MARPTGGALPLSSGQHARLLRRSALLGLMVLVLLIETTSAAAPEKHSQQQPKSTKSKPPPPLIGEESSGKNRRSADCHFGKKVYELEETWHPDLGSPFGIMYCIRCECMAVQKKKRIAGRTLCRNIKNECPKPNCDEPVLLPGRCCKVCLEEGAGGLGPLKEDVARAIESDDDDKQAKDFAALLTKKTSSAQQDSLANLATGRFSFQKRHLYFSLVVPQQEGVSGPPPRYLQFLSEDGSILEEQELATNDYYNATGKVCGVWRKVPRIYKQLLREEKIWVALMDDKDSEAITGRVARYKALSTELLSAVLTPNGPCPGCGGTAAISMASASNSIHVTVAVSGLVAKGADLDTIVVRLETVETANAPSRIVDELVTAQKPVEVNVVEMRIVLESQEMRLLLRGQIQLSVHTKRAPEHKLRGVVGPRIACDLFDSLVTAADALPAEEASAVQQQPSSALGLAWMYIGKTGSVHYRIQLRGVQSKVTRITIESSGSVVGSKTTGTKRTGSPKMIEDVTSHLALDGWVNGTVSRLSAKDLELLYDGELYVNVASEQWPTSEIRGKLVPRLAGESHLATQNGPVLLNPVGNATVPSRAAMGWVHVDNECNFHYDVAVTGSTGGPQRSREATGSLTVLELVDIPRLTIEPGSNPSGVATGGIMLMDGAESAGISYGEIPFMPNIRLLEEFSGYQVENSVGDLNKLSLARMDAGVAYLKLTEAPANGGTPGAQFQGWLTNVQVPDSCLPYGSRPMPGSDGSAGEQSVGYVFDQRSQDDNNEIPLTATTRCFYEGKLYDDGSAWTAEHDRCMMCSCQRGRVVCDPIVCPALTCGPSANIVHPPGDCCPKCENVTKVMAPTDSSSPRGCYFEGDKTFHPAGSTWHPYLPPFGFSKCALCVCNESTLKVVCTKLTCPPLNCSESEAYRPDPAACCKQCPTIPPTTVAPAPGLATPPNKETLLLEEGQARGEIDILSSGGCRFKGDVFENGEDWHPRIQPWGEMKCINCNCKDGKVKCKRKKCTKTRCANGRPAVLPPSSSGGEEQCCPSCPEDGLSPPVPSSPFKNKNAAGAGSSASSSGGSSSSNNDADADAKKKKTTQREGRARQQPSSPVASSSRTHSGRQTQLPV